MSQSISEVTYCLSFVRTFSVSVTLIMQFVIFSIVTKETRDIVQMQVQISSRILVHVCIHCRPVKISHIRHETRMLRVRFTLVAVHS